MIRRRIRSFVDPGLKAIGTRLARHVQDNARTSTATKVAQQQLYHYYRDRAASGSLPPLRETGFRCFSQFDEDGKLLFIFSGLGIRPGTFVEIGAADGINSNCANLALNFGWHGAFIDGDAASLERGRRFYDRHPDTWAYPPIFVEARVDRENINDVLRRASVPVDVDLMSIDIDGNDYWIWEAIEWCSPKVVIIETNIEFGSRGIVVPYNPAHIYPGRHPQYHGASASAMMRLGKRKGYRLVGANDYGFNAIYVRTGIGEAALPEVAVDDVLSHPRTAARAVLFDPISTWEYVER